HENKRPNLRRAPEPRFFSHFGRIVRRKQGFQDSNVDGRSHDRSPARSALRYRDILRLMLQIVSPQDPFDAIVVGSGATGGWAVKKLTESGMRVALLEAGKKITPKDFTEHTRSWQLPYLGLSPKIREERPIQSLVY